VSARRVDVARVLERVETRIQLPRISAHGRQRLAAELREAREALEEAKFALRKIQAEPFQDCGCSPCMGACRSGVAVEIELDARRDLAGEALARLGGVA
jgi:hypothetical protein